MFSSAHCTLPHARCQVFKCTLPSCQLHISKLLGTHCTLPHAHSHDFMCIFICFHVHIAHCHMYTLPKLSGAHCHVFKCTLHIAACTLAKLTSAHSIKVHITINCTFPSFQIYNCASSQCSNPHCQLDQGHIAKYPKKNFQNDCHKHIFHGIL
jgi:hypothetical protein